MPDNTTIDAYMSIDTPENVAFGYKVAGIGSRFLAALVDTFLILVLQIIVIFTLLFAARLLAPDMLGFDSPAFVWLAAILGLAAFAFLWGYYILFEMIWNGQSPGKRWVGIRVLKTDGTPITLAESVIRNLVRLIDFLPAYYGVGVVTMFISEQSRRLGDLAAGTIVVYDRGTVTLESLVEKPAIRHNSPLGRLVQAHNSEEEEKLRSLIARLPIERLGETELRLADDFLRRRDELANRAALSESVLKMLYDKMSLPLVKPASARETETLIAALLKACRDRLESTSG